jgi:hypothetical protein
MVVVPPVAIEPKHPYGYMILLEKNGARLSTPFEPYPNSGRLSSSFLSIGKSS